MECQQAPGQDQVASELCGTEGYHSCSSGPSVVVSGGRFVWCCEVGGERGSACGGRPGWGGDQQRRGGERLRCPLCVARLVAACFTPVGDRQLPDEPSASHTPPSGSAAGSAPPPSSAGKQQAARVLTCQPLFQPLRQPLGRPGRWRAGASAVGRFAAPGVVWQRGSVSGQLMRGGEIFGAPKWKSRESIDDRKRFCLCFWQNVDEALRAFCP